MNISDQEYSEQFRTLVCQALRIDPGMVLAIDMHTAFSGGYGFLMMAPPPGDDNLPYERQMTEAEYDVASVILADITAQRAAHRVALRYTTDRLPQMHDQAIGLIRDLADLMAKMDLEPALGVNTLADVNEQTLRALTHHVENHGRSVMFRAYTATPTMLIAHDGEVTFLPPSDS
jgi:hypothetical protein